MKKCLICQICSWIVGLATLILAASLWFGWVGPLTPLMKVASGSLLIITLGFLSYQIVPCPRCVARQREMSADV